MFTRSGTYGSCLAASGEETPGGEEGSVVILVGSAIASAPLESRFVKVILARLAG